jgi:triosephosphate isomerase
MNRAARTPLVAGNWKMHGSLAESGELVAALRRGLESQAGRERARMLLCPPYPYLKSVVEWVAGSDIAVGAQDVSAQAGQGAFTGEVAGGMLVDVGCAYAIVGHSERRVLFGETDAIVAAKFNAARAVGLVPILCVGETLEEREAGRTEAVVERQVAAVLATAGAGAFAQAAVAYEPVWAIGTGRTASPEQAQEVHGRLRAQLARGGVGEVPVLYGGSVKAGNAAQLLAMDDIDGGLVGGASLDASEFLSIFRAACTQTERP